MGKKREKKDVERGKTFLADPPRTAYSEGGLKAKTVREKFQQARPTKKNNRKKKRKEKKTSKSPGYE